MNGKDYLLDTNIVIGLWANDETIVQKVKSLNRLIQIPSIVLGELLYGAENSTRKESNKQRVDELIKIVFVVGCDAETARHYAIIKSQLKLKGTPIPENDLWIAALAKQHDLILVSRDAHFKRISELTLEGW
jgi:tRNA(fMet)-specific endonuclease VapC